MPQRAVGVIVKNDKVLLMRRIRNGQEYYVFPDGGVKEGESTETATIREIKEELSINPKIDKLLFEIENQDRQEYYYLIKEFSGQPQLGGEEKQRMNENNQYHPIWMSLDKLRELDNLYPKEDKSRIIKEINSIN